MSDHYSQKLTREYMDELASRGCYHFTIDEFARARGSSINAARAALRRLGEHGSIAMPCRGFLLIVPPEYRALGCLPADQFIPQLMDHLGQSYYVGLLSAARYHGAAHQAPQTFQIMTPKNRKSLQCGKVKVDFIAKTDCSDTPIMKFNTPRGVIKVSTPEATAFDLIGYHQHCGGFDHVATILAELSEKLSSQKLVDIAAIVPMPWVQRLGYLLQAVGAHKKANSLKKIVQTCNPPITPLLPGVSMAGSVKDPTFRVAMNTEIEPDL